MAARASPCNRLSCARRPGANLATKSCHSRAAFRRDPRALRLATLTYANDYAAGLRGSHSVSYACVCVAARNPRRHDGGRRGARSNFRRYASPALKPKLARVNRTVLPLADTRARATQHGAYGAPQQPHTPNLVERRTLAPCAPSWRAAPVRRAQNQTNSTPRWLAQPKRRGKNSRHTRITRRT